jgi:hypothetical protein
MVNAVLALHKSPRPAHKSSHGIQSRRNARRTTRLNRQPQAILTTFEMQKNGPGSNNGLVYTQPIRSSPAYAAVPFGDGWLVIQL